MVDKHIKMLFSLKMFNYEQYVIIMLIHIKSNGLKKGERKTLMSTKI